MRQAVEMACRNEAPGDPRGQCWRKLPVSILCSRDWVTWGVGGKDTCTALHHVPSEP